MDGRTMNVPTANAPMEMRMERGVRIWMRMRDCIARSSTGGVDGIVSGDARMRRYLRCEVAAYSFSPLLQRLSLRLKAKDVDVRCAVSM